MELPVVATRIPGCVDAVRDGETGLLVPVRDAEALTAAIRIYLDDPTLRRQHGTNGRHRALRDFDPEDDARSPVPRIPPLACRARLRRSGESCLTCGPGGGALKHGKTLVKLDPDHVHANQA